MPLTVIDMTERRFKVDASTCTCAELIAANADDDALIDWACTAAVGDVFPAFINCERTA